MKALTVQQPWAWAIVHGGKSVENRTQQWTYRGPLAIHAGTRWSTRGARSPLVISAFLNALAREGWVPLGSRQAMEARAAEIGLAPGGMWVSGAIIGVVDLVDVHRDAGCCRPWGESSYDGRGGRRRRDVVHLVLEHPRPVKPIYCRGALGLWTPPAEVLPQVEAVIGR